jgi:hypothetical protein
LAEAASAPGLGAGREWRFAPASLARWAAAIDRAHTVAGFDPPGRSAEVRATLSGIRRARSEPPKRRAPLLTDELEVVVGALRCSGWPGAVWAWRDRVILVAGWVGAFRRSELAALRWGDVAWHPLDGVHVRLARSKTDQEGFGSTKGLPVARRRPLLCAPCALVAWGRLTLAAEASRSEAMRVLAEMVPAPGISATPACPPAWTPGRRCCDASGGAGASAGRCRGTPSARS